MAARVGVVIPAAGQARRFGSAESKIWAVIAGKTVLERTLNAFDTHPEIASIVVAASPEDLQRVRNVAARYSRIVGVVAGGETRSESVRKGLDALPPNTEIVLVHDAARPLVCSALISRVISATQEHGAAVPGTPLSDTVKRANSARMVRATVPRYELHNGETLEGLTAVQTPQGARLAVLQHAYAAFDATGGEATDEASLVEAAGGIVAITQGDVSNIKITRAEDIAVAELLLGAPEVRMGLGYDVHAFAHPDAGRPLYIGGVEIPHDKGLDGHSDADVALHAICDALLGAASLGDIGILFPNTDSAYKNISSLKLLHTVRERLTEQGWAIINIDATVVAEAPKLMPHRPAMLAAISSELGIEEMRVSIKATTSEGMGFVGRGEGIACWAAATVQRAR